MDLNKVQDATIKNSNSSLTSVLKHKGSKDSIECNGSPSKASKKSNRHVSFSAIPSIYPVENLSQYNALPASYELEDCAQIDYVPSYNLSDEILTTSQTDGNQVLDAQPIIKSKAFFTYTPVARVLNPKLVGDDNLNKCSYNVVGNVDKSVNSKYDIVPSVSGLAPNQSVDNNEIIIRNRLLYDDMPKNRLVHNEVIENPDLSDSLIENIKNRLQRRVDVEHDSYPTAKPLENNENSNVQFKIQSSVPPIRNKTTMIPAKNVGNAKGAIAALALGTKPKVYKITPISSRIRIEAPRSRDKILDKVITPSELISLPLSGFSNSSGDITSDNKANSHNFKLLENSKSEPYSVSRFENTKKVAKVVEKSSDQNLGILPVTSTPRVESSNSSFLPKDNVTSYDLEYIGLVPSDSCQTVSNISNDVSMESIQISLSEDVSNENNKTLGDLNKSPILDSCEENTKSPVSDTIKCSLNNSYLHSEIDGNENFLELTRSTPDIIECLSSNGKTTRISNNTNIMRENNKVCPFTTNEATKHSQRQDSEDTISDPYVDLLSPSEVPEFEEMNTNKSKVNYSNYLDNINSSNAFPLSNNAPTLQICENYEKEERRNLVTSTNATVKTPDTDERSDSSFCSATSPGDFIVSPVEDYLGLPCIDRKFINSKNINFENSEKSSAESKNIIKNIEPRINGQLPNLCSHESEEISNQTSSSYQTSIDQNQIKNTSEQFELDSLAGTNESTRDMSSDEIAAMYGSSSIDTDAAICSIEEDSVPSPDMISESIEMNDENSLSTDESNESSSKNVSNIVEHFKNISGGSSKNKVNPKHASHIPSYKGSPIPHKSNSGKISENEPGNTNSLSKYRKKNVFSNRKALFERLEQNNLYKNENSRILEKVSKSEDSSQSINSGCSGNIIPKNNISPKPPKRNSFSKNYMRKIPSNSSQENVNYDKIVDKFSKSIKDELKDVGNNFKIDPTKSPTVKRRHSTRDKQASKIPDMIENQKDAHTLPRVHSPSAVRCHQRVSKPDTATTEKQESAEKQFYRNSMEIKFQNPNENFCNNKLRTSFSKRNGPKVVDRQPSEISVPVASNVRGNFQDNSMLDPKVILSSNCQLTELLNYLEKEQRDLDHLSKKVEISENRDMKQKIISYDGKELKDSDWVSTKEEVSVNQETKPKNRKLPKVRRLITRFEKN